MLKGVSSRERTWTRLYLRRERGLSRPDIVDLVERLHYKALQHSGLYLDLLGHFPAGIDPVALERAEYCIEAVFFDPEPIFQGLDHLPMSMSLSTCLR